MKTLDVSAIVAAYNEAPRIGTVLDILTEYPGFREIIVVDDGSTDGTDQVVARYPGVSLIRHEVNQGKGKAIDSGVAVAQTDAIFLCDADIDGLIAADIEKLVQPVVKGAVVMMIAARTSGNARLFTFLYRWLPSLSLISGQRVMRRQLWQELPVYFKHGFRMEYGLNLHARAQGGYDYTILPGLQHVAVKEKKYGLLRGVLARVGMIYDFWQAFWMFQRYSLQKKPPTSG